MLSTLERSSRINLPSEEMGIEYDPRGTSPKRPQKRMKPAGNVGSEVPVTSKKKNTTPKTSAPPADNPKTKALELQKRKKL